MIHYQSRKNTSQPDDEKASDKIKATLRPLRGWKTISKKTALALLKDKDIGVEEEVSIGKGLTLKKIEGPDLQKLAKENAARRKIEKAEKAKIQKEKEETIVDRKVLKREKKPKLKMKETT